jgi:hypothetical protein
MPRPNDVPSWGQCTTMAWRWCRWMLVIIPISAVIVWLLSMVIFVEPKTPASAREIHDYTILMAKAMTVVSTFLWTVIFGNTILQVRWEPTRLEIEARERATLASLRAKYEEDANG